ncbi:tRNA glutamyl-Q(34) synthetase GluQRS [Alicyclobacillus cycloheptanicus]|uniref:Glutamyl-Q tRNA(Asp) synthetase n=1 Tax=Alicyclobacillus cycloheptanicus TaxID=1457 RepID=A0ABT9XJ34_9BACL|nr:tRNA glutamyl-Q(34) synthetase GluQRS [Alicyclobacillus cycloheptanicus]MDQ0189798.1 glutamyl-tRNA synthetase [Alicyclobacillus cycloheptanicus]WDM02510.1 tRNA glutamyl-Q(34) synthetase GluQRS [Alicyclobacillus cycloheptanicus]
MTSASSRQCTTAHPHSASPLPGAARRGRFAPTPSGRLHLGNARTALLAWLQMRNAGGTFILRMEDIDRARSRLDIAAELLTDLRWLGIDWDEGPDIGGPYAPYTQSEREALYEAAYERLQQAGLLYPCYCSRAELTAIASAPHGLPAEGPVYPGTCRHLSPAERAERAARKQPAMRFSLPDRPVSFHDLVLGWQHFPAGYGGDFIVKRADGVFSYQLAVVADDAAMHITDVLRGDDLLDSTPRQIWLYEALGLPVPQFAHVPLLLGPDGRRLAKRDGAIAIAELRRLGVRPERVVGQFAYSCGLIDRPEPVAARELIPLFDLTRLNRIPSLIDEAWRM